MEQRPEIVLPAGTEFVETAEIPVLIAEALYPSTADDRRLVTRLTKTSKAHVAGETAGWNASPLEKEDWNVLKTIWHGQPTFPMDEKEWAPYELAFQRGGKHLDWEPTCVISSTHLNSDILRAAATEEHRQEVISSISAGKLEAVSRVSRLPVSDYVSRSVVAVDALRRYVAPFHVDVRVAVPANDLPQMGLADDPPVCSEWRPNEPRLQRGTNPQKNIKAWVEWQAHQLVKQGDTVNILGERIYLEAQRCAYLSARGPLSIASVVRLLPQGVTGGRSKSRLRVKKH